MRTAEGGGAAHQRTIARNAKRLNTRDVCAVKRHRRRILVTGAAGLIGSELCGQLVERGHAVIALIHQRHDILRNNGSVLHPPAYTGTPPRYGALRWVAGDIRKHSLGLEANEAVTLASVVEVIIHCAAETKFSSACDLHRIVNVEGTRNVARFARASQGPIPGLVHVSTAYVSGERSGHVA